MNSIKFILDNLLDKRRPMLLFCLLKYLRYEDIVKLSLVSKNTGRLCDANKSHSDDSNSNEIKIKNTLRYLILVIAVQSKA